MSRQLISFFFHLKQIFTCKKKDQKIDHTELNHMNKKKRQSIEETIEEKSPDENGAATALIPSTLTNV